MATSCSLNPRPRSQSTTKHTNTRARARIIPEHIHIAHKHFFKHIRMDTKDTDKSFMLIPNTKNRLIHVQELRYGPHSKLKTWMHCIEFVLPPPTCYLPLWCHSFLKLPHQNQWQGADNGESKKNKHVVVRSLRVISFFVLLPPLFLLPKLPPPPLSHLIRQILSGHLNYLHINPADVAGHL